jgi:hypothetical protein
MLSARARRSQISRTTGPARRTNAARVHSFRNLMQRGACALYLSDDGQHVCGVQLLELARQVTDRSVSRSHRGFCQQIKRLAEIGDHFEMGSTSLGRTREL